MRGVVGLVLVLAGLTMAVMILRGKWPPKALATVLGGSSSASSSTQGG